MSTDKKSHRGPAREHTQRKNELFGTKHSEPSESDDEESGSTIGQRLLKCRKQIQRAEYGFRTELYDALKEAYRIADDLGTRNKDWNYFCDLEYWSECGTRLRPKPTTPVEEYIRYVLLHIYRVTNSQGPRYNRAYKYARTLQSYAAQKVPIEEVTSKLRREGVDYIFDFRTEEPVVGPVNQKGTEKTVSEDKLSKSDAEEDVDNEDDIQRVGRRGRPQVPRRAAASGPRGRGRSGRPAEPAKARRMLLEVEMDLSDLDAVINAVKRGKSPKLELSLVDEPLEGKPDNWTRIRGVVVT